MILASEPLLVVHAEDAYRTNHDVTSREGAVLGQGQDVERVPVPSQGARDEAVVRRVDRRREEPPVQEDHVPVVVVLVLVAGASGDLDDHLQGLRTGHAGDVGGRNVLSPRAGG
jgi:hypothetical protein